MSRHPRADASEVARATYRRFHDDMEPVLAKVAAPEFHGAGVELGPLTRACYRRSKVEGGQKVSPEYCHAYGEDWSAAEFDKKADRLVRDEDGHLFILQRGHTTVTDHGIEDKAMHALPGASRRNPATPTVTLPEAGKLATYRRVAPRGGFTTFLLNLAAGAVGAVAAPLAQHYLLRNTRWTPAERAQVVGAVGALAAAVLAPRAPRLATGVGLGTVAATAPAVLESVEVWSAQRTLAAEVAADRAQLAAQPPAPPPAPPPSPGDAPP